MEYALTSENINKICAVIDCQGFQLSNYFYPRELAIVNSTTNLTFDVDTEIDRDELSMLEKGCIHYQTSQIHGLTLKPDKAFIKVTTFENFLNVMILMVKSEEKPLVAIKNYQLGGLLKQFGIDFINLDKGELVPSMEKIDEMSKNAKWSCSLHTATRQRNSRCSLRKCSRLWNFLNKIKYDMFEKSLYLKS